MFDKNRKTDRCIWKHTHPAYYNILRPNVTVILKIVNESTGLFKQQRLMLL